MRGSATLTIKKTRFEERISRFASLHHADRHWQRALYQAGKTVRVSCAELTSLLVREDRQPVLIFASLLKVSEIGGRHFLYFDEATILESQLSLFLECTPEQANYADNQRDFLNSFGIDTYVVVADVQMVDCRPGERTIWAVGECVDLMYIDLNEAWYLSYPESLEVF